jgi:hypothetical protein
MAEFRLNWAGSKAKLVLVENGKWMRLKDKGCVCQFHHHKVWQATL